ncbi:hypothetical protein WNZ14_07790 [Hoeflea sp. AS60]|uniref:hypothetical protein n=1 Tax=Hoeflea sp. AS60 TaxID=3135780 RepID=UPI00316F7BBC
MLSFLKHICIFAVLTVATQIGGLAWLIALLFKRRMTIFAASYAVLSFAALWVAPMLGREPLPCIGAGSLQMQSKIYCLLNRHYVVPEMKASLNDLAAQMESEFPGTMTLVLDANFPFIAGFPLLPHLSHDDGRKADLAFYYRENDAYMPGYTRSPVGYFAFEPGPTNCPSQLISLRWDMDWLQGFWPDYQLDEARVKSALEWLSSDERIEKVFIEPHLRERFGIQSDKIRFQGCRAARHDDHIHIQL